MAHAPSLNSLAQPNLAQSTSATSAQMVSASPTQSSALMPPLAALMMLKSNALMVHANQHSNNAAQSQLAQKDNPSAMMVHAPRAALVLTRLVALTTKSNVPTDNALTQPRLNAQLLHAQLKDLPSVSTDNVSHPSPTVHPLFQRMTSTSALATHSETSFLALTVLALPLLNNADLSFLALISS